MTAVQDIKDMQWNWASAKGIPCDSRGYVREVEDNLYQPLSRHARRGYERGAGAELRGNMRALHSSSALVVNLFDHWTDRERSPLLSALGLDPAVDVALDFEARFPTGWAARRRTLTYPYHGATTKSVQLRASSRST